MQISEFQLYFTLRLSRNARQLTCSIRVRTFGVSFNSLLSFGISLFVVLLYTLWPHPAEKSVFWQCVVHGVKLTTKSLTEPCCNTTELILWLLVNIAIYYMIKSCNSFKIIKMQTKFLQISCSFGTRLMGLFCCCCYKIKWFNPSIRTG